MRRQRNARPVIEPMESKLLLTAMAVTTSPVAALVAGVAATPPASRLVELNGTLHGSYHTTKHNPDLGHSIDLYGSGQVSHLGRTLVSGHISGPGNIAHGRAEGTLFLVDAHGTLTLRLEGPDQKGFAPLPTLYHFTVVGGTGAFKNVHDSGNLTLDLTHSLAKGGKTAATPGDIEFGKFSMNLYSTEHAPPPTPKA